MTVLKLWLISQDENCDFDTYDSAVVCAETEEDARQVHPGSILMRKYYDGAWHWEDGEAEFGCGTWAAPQAVKVQLIGEAVAELTAGQVVCASFNAG